MELELGGCTALVVGGSSGIGAETAAVLAEEGCDVAITFSGNASGAQDTADRVRALGREAWTARVDLSVPHDVAAALDPVTTAAGGFDVVVLAAGRNIVTPWDRLGVDEFRLLLDVNLTGAFAVLQAVAPHVRDGGSVVTVSSVAAWTGAPHHPHYAAAKAGLVNLTTSFARALAPRVRVNGVAPGITLTAMGEDTVANLPADYAQRSLLLQRYATPRRVAQTVAFVASPLAEFMTGTTVDVNSGRHLR